MRVHRTYTRCWVDLQIRFEEKVDGGWYKSKPKVSFSFRFISTFRHDVCLDFDPNLDSVQDSV